MKVVVVYIYPMVKTDTYFGMAKRFADTWKKFPPGRDFDLHVMTNGASAGPNDKWPFNGINCEFHPYRNSGWDVGAYLWAAMNLKSDLMVCLGAHVHFHHEGWLNRIADSYIENGPGIYGCWGYDYPTVHIRTTAFWCAPQLLLFYPYQVTSARESRYAFEHGSHSITKIAMDAGLPAVMVTMKGSFTYPDWSPHVPGRSDSLLLDRFQES